MKWYVGTSGYSYKEWKGYFYPEKHPDKEMLSFYAGRLPSVEINNTFYRVPRTSVIENWAEQVGEDFRFAVKATRRITHFKRLREVGEDVDFFLRTVGTLGKRLGVVLFQLPPNLKKDAGLLKDFLDQVPKGAPTALEFRHESWFDDEVYGLLEAGNCALCIADTEADSKIEVTRTANWGYLRLRKPDYKKKDLVAWAKQIEVQKWEHAFVFFKHEDEGAGPKMAARLLDISG